MVGGVAFDAAMLAHSGSVAIASAAVTLLGLASTGFMVWRETDDAWEHTPALGGS